MVKPTILVNNKLYYSFAEAAECLNMSQASLRRECDRKNIRYMNHVTGKIFAQEWLDEYCERKTIAPRKLQR